MLPFGKAILLGATIVVHVCFGAAVLVDARTLYRSSGLMLVGPVVWTLAVLVGGVLTAALYWLVHHSAIRR